MLSLKAIIWKSGSVTAHTKHYHQDPVSSNSETFSTCHFSAARGWSFFCLKSPNGFSLLVSNSTNSTSNFRNASYHRQNSTIHSPTWKNNVDRCCWKEIMIKLGWELELWEWPRDGSRWPIQRAPLVALISSLFSHSLVAGSDCTSALDDLEAWQIDLVPQV